MNDVFACENPIYVSPTLVKMFRPETAICLEKFHCWLQENQMAVDGQRWIQGNLDSWGKELPFLAPRTMRNIVKQFQKFGLLVVSRHNGAEWYTLDYTELMKHVADYRAKHGAGNPCPMSAKGGETK